RNLKTLAPQTNEQLAAAPRDKLVGVSTADEKPSLASKILVFVLCTTIVLATVLFGMVDAGLLAVFCVGAGIVGWLWLTDAWKTSELRYSPSLLPLPMIGLIIIGLIQLLPLRSASLPETLLTLPASNALSLDAFATRLAVTQLVAMLIYFAAALVFINTNKRLQKVTTTIIILGFAMAVFGIIQYLGGDSKAWWVRESSQAMPFASFINRHHFGALMEMTMGLALGLLYTSAIDREKRVLYVFAVVVMGVALVLTSSRGALLSFFGLVIFLTLAVFTERRKNNFADEERDTDKSCVPSRLALLGGGLCLVLIVVGAVLLLGGDSSLLRSIGATGGTGDVSSGRLQFWQTTLLMIRDFPFLGVGLDAFGVAYTRYDAMNGYFRLEQAHNEYLQVWAEAGIGGLILVLSFIFLLFRGGLQVFMTTRDRFRRGAAIGALAGCFGVIIHSFFDFPLRTPSNLLTFLILAALATVTINPPKTHHKNNL
ncbi:MAG: O-antigen ligase family protein, partial [Pyrinomonadaceae bacterium]